MGCLRWLDVRPAALAFLAACAPPGAGPPKAAAPPALPGAVGSVSTEVVQAASAAPPPGAAATLARAVQSSSPKRNEDLADARRFLESGIRAVRGPRKVGKTVERAEVGFAARSLSTGEILYESNAAAMLSAASNTKLFTTAAALVRLGGSYRFETRFASDAPIRSGVLEGDLWVVGGGDPTLTTDQDWCPAGPEVALARVAEELAVLGIERVAGALVLDDRLFEPPSYHPGWPARDRGRPHALDVSALCVERHRIRIAVSASPSGVELHVVPRLRGIRVENAVKVVKGANASITAHVLGDSIHVSGSIPPGGSDATSVHWLDGPKLFGAVCLEAFASRGVTVQGATRLPGNGEAAPRRTLVVLPSAVPLTEVIRVTNQESDNLYAEMLLKALGARFRGEGSFAAGVEVVRETLRQLGLTTAGFDAVDGSGLARASKASAKEIAALLEAMARSPQGGAFRDSLAVGGARTGTLRRRFREPSVAGRVRAKTGSLDGVSSLSGYAEAPSGETFVFSILVNFEKGGSSKADEEQWVRRILSIGAP